METESRGPEGAGDQSGGVEGTGRMSPAGQGRAPKGLTGDGLRRVAIEEMALRRRRLGELTPAQERALESLLMSVADHISELVSGVVAGTTRQWRVEEGGRPAVVSLGACSPAQA